MIGSSHSQLCKKYSCSVKLQGGPLDHNPRKIPDEDSWIIILQNNFKCLLLNNNATGDTVQFVRPNTEQKKVEHTWIERKEFEKKVREIGWVVLIFIELYLLFCRAL